MEISGTSALVTGGASGLGLATVTALVKSGARVIALDRPSANRDALDAVGGTVEFAAATSLTRIPLPRPLSSPTAMASCGSSSTVRELATRSRP